MILQREILQAKKQHEIRTMLTQYGASWSAKEKKTELIDRLIQISMTVQPNERVKKEEEKPKEVPSYPTIDEILKEVQPYREHGLNVAFTEDGSAWLFSIVKRGKTIEDTGTTKQPLSVIRRCADLLVRL